MKGEEQTFSQWSDIEFFPLNPLLPLIFFFFSLLICFDNLAVNAWWETILKSERNQSRENAIIQVAVNKFCVKTAPRPKKAPTYNTQRVITVITRSFWSSSYFEGGVGNLYDVFVLQHISYWVCFLAAD